MQRNITEHNIPRDLYHFLVEEARRNNDKGNINQFFKCYKYARYVFSLIEQKNPDDYRKEESLNKDAANIKREEASENGGIAVKNFNKRDYTQAIIYYDKEAQCIMAIKHEFNVELTDNDLRKLIECLTDMSDAYLHLFNRDAADIAFSNAIKAFGFIKAKTAEERELEKKNDPALIRRFYEKKTSTPHYLESNDYNTNESMLYRKHNEKMIFDGIKNMGLSEEKQEKVSLSQQTLFASPQHQQTTSDTEYRDMAYDLYNIGITQLKISDKIGTFKKALEAYGKIREKEGDDFAAIKEINQQIDKLQTQQKNPVSTLGWFGAQPQAQQPPSADYSEDAMHLDPM